MSALPVRSAGYLPESLSSLDASQGVATVEIVDVAPALCGDAGPHSTDAAAREGVARSLVGAFRRTGFAVITGHGVDQRLFDAMTAVTQEFFDLPLQEKSRVGFPAPEVIRGYEPVPATSEEVRSTNAMECFLINRLTDPHDYAPGSAEARIWRWPNVWPARPDTMRAVWERYYTTMDHLGATLLELVAVGLGLPPEWFGDKFDRHFSNLAANHYPPLHRLPGLATGMSATAAPMRNRPHTDHGGLTLLYRPSEPGGLEVFSHGAWLQVPYLPGSLVINVGDIVDRWTGGLLPATPHRVVGAAGDTAGQSRYSIVYFQQPNPDALIEPAPGLADSRRPVRAGAHISSKELGAATVAALGV